MYLHTRVILTELKQDLLEEWLGNLKGTVEELNENGCTGRCFYGVFKC